jgi:hypothetical protein
MWTCKKCKIEGNYATRKKCRGCQAPRPDDAAGEASSPWRRGGSGTGGGSAGGSGAGGSAAEDALKKEVKDKEKEVNRLKAELLAAKKAKDKDKEANEDDQPEQDRQMLAGLRTSVTFLEKQHADLGFAAVIAEKKMLIEGMVQKRLEAKPPATQLKDLDDKLLKKAKDLEESKKKYDSAMEDAQGHAAKGVELQQELVALERKKQILLSQAAAGAMETTSQRANRFDGLLEQAIACLGQDDAATKPVLDALKPLQKQARDIAASSAGAEALAQAAGGGGGAAPPVGGGGGGAGDPDPTQRYGAQGVPLQQQQQLQVQQHPPELSMEDIDLDSPMVLQFLGPGSDEDDAKRKAGFLEAANAVIAKRHAAGRPL